jgi:hypothetical protein
LSHSASPLALLPVKWVVSELSFCCEPHFPHLQNGIADEFAVNVKRDENGSSQSPQATMITNVALLLTF